MGGFDLDGEYSSQVGVDDLVLVTKVDNESIMKNLRERAAAEVIYTWIGHVLIAMNPYKRLPIYSEAILRSYVGRYRSELAPHVYMVAEDAFRTMVAEEENQCVIISGESGAGKTESAKLIMNYVAAVSKQAAGVEHVKQIVLGSNPLLEAFGNAKTLRNNNSSRFGKYVEIKFDIYGAPKGGHVRNYLLEKSRVVSQTKGERNFHVFYQLLLGAGPGIKEALRLTKPDDFHYLRQSRCAKVDGIDDRKEFAATQQAMRMVGLKGRAQEAIFKLLAGILHLGNTTFVEHGQGCKPKDMGAVKLGSHYLGLDPTALAQALCFRHMETRDESYDVPQNVLQATVARDAVCKSLYTKLFDWLVTRVNVALDKGDDGGEHLEINVLDIYGFEVFETNGFEQFLINYVNEKLQQIFIELTLRAEQDEYQHEGIAWKPIKFFNNKIVCDLIELKRPQPGLLAILDDVCKTLHATSKGADDKYVQKAAQFHSSHQHFVPSSAGFTIQHYAGPVEYEKLGFCQANKDNLIIDILSVLKASSIKFIQILYPESLDASVKPTTVGHKMKTQCASLVEALMACNPHYVRCIKPNDVKNPGIFNAKRIVHQIKYLGLLENVRVRRAGFAYRQEFHRFNERYRILVPKKKRKGRTDKDICKNMLKFLAKALQVSSDDCQLGKTKLFIKKPETIELAEELRSHRCGDAATVIQKAWKKYKNVEHLIKLRRGANKFVGKHKARRRESLMRPFDSDYVGFHSAAFQEQRDFVQQFFEAGEEMVYSEEVTVLRAKPKQPTRPSFFVVTDKALYLFRKRRQEKVWGANGAEFLQLDARVHWALLKGMTMSTLADNVLVLHCKPGRVKAAPEWMKDREAASCLQCKVAFGLFTWRHHCRLCGKVYCDACVPDKVGLAPLLGVNEPCRMCVQCRGKAVLEPGGDVVLQTSRKTEVMAVILSQVHGRDPAVEAKFKDQVTVSVAAHDPKTKLLKTTQYKVTFTHKPSLGEECQGQWKVQAGGTQVSVTSPSGVPRELIAKRRKLEDLRRKEREKQRQAEMVERKRLEEERQVTRERERKARIKAKKARKKAALQAKREEEEEKAARIAKRGGRAPPLALTKKRD